MEAEEEQWQKWNKWHSDAIDEGHDATDYGFKLVSRLYRQARTDGTYGPPGTSTDGTGASAHGLLSNVRQRIES